MKCFYRQTDISDTGLVMSTGHWIRTTNVALLEEMFLFSSKHVKTRLRFTL